MQRISVDRGAKARTIERWAWLVMSVVCCVMAIANLVQDEDTLAMAVAGAGMGFIAMWAVRYHEHEFHGR